MGEKLETLDVFYPERMAQRILGMGDVVSLVERAQEQFDEEQAKKLEKRIKKETLYYVRKGDSLFSIAKKHPGVTISDIKKWNGIEGSELKPGMKLKISG
jgi:signal recognition particle subunit SRP54